jgi:hypothetical protein
MIGRTEWPTKETHLKAKNKCRKQNIKWQFRAWNPRQDIGGTVLGRYKKEMQIRSIWDIGILGLGCGLDRFSLDAEYIKYTKFNAANVTKL